MTTPEDVAVIVSKLTPYLKGQVPELQGAVLADLLSMWLTGFPDFLRERILQTHLDAVRELVPVNEKILFGSEGHPLS